MCCRRRQRPTPVPYRLLEFVLEALYQAGRAERLLTFAAYRALGGLEGAIARRADEVVDALSPTVQDALPTILRALTTVRLGDNAVTAAPAARDNMARTPAQSGLLDALIAARLLVSDENLEGQAVVRVAHEALLSRWPRARDIVNADRKFSGDPRPAANRRQPLACRQQEPRPPPARRQATCRGRGIADVAAGGRRRSDSPICRSIVTGSAGGRGTGATGRSRAHRG